MEAFDAVGMLAPAWLPEALEQQGLAVRPPLTAGAQPLAAVVLIEFDARGAGGANA